MFITVLFKNGHQIDGNLISIEKNEMRIKSLEGSSITTIPNIAETILFYKTNSAEKKFSELSQKVVRGKEDLYELARLKGDLLDIERATIREKLTPPSAILPKAPINVFHTTQPSTPEHTSKETSRASSSFNSELQGLFSKGH